MKDDEMIQILEYGLMEWGIVLNAEQRERFMRLTRWLMDWNKRMNLTNITEPERIAVEHYLDSVAPLAFGLLQGGMRVVDVGTGAGFPGLPLAILRPQASFTLVEATRKKTDYLRAVMAELGLTGVEVVWGRAETLAHQPEYRERFGVAIARALGALDVVLECTLPFVKVGGIAVAYKGPRVSGELAFGEKVAALLGGQIEKVHRFPLPQSDLQRTLVVVRKTTPTPPRFPRRAGLPEKRPLRLLRKGA